MPSGDYDLTHFARENNSKSHLGGNKKSFSAFRNHKHSTATSKYQSTWWPWVWKLKLPDHACLTLYDDCATVWSLDLHQTNTIPCVRQPKWDEAERQDCLLKEFFAKEIVNLVDLAFMLLLVYLISPRQIIFIHHSISARVSFDERECRREYP